MFRTRYYLTKVIFFAVLCIGLSLVFYVEFGSTGRIITGVRGLTPDSTQTQIDQNRADIDANREDIDAILSVNAVQHDEGCQRLVERICVLGIENDLPQIIGGCIGIVDIGIDIFDETAFTFSIGFDPQFEFPPVFLVSTALNPTLTEAKVLSVTENSAEFRVIDEEGLDILPDLIMIKVNGCEVFGEGLD